MKASTAAVLCPWLMSPWMAAAFQPLRFSRPSTRGASFLYSTKMMMRFLRLLWCCCSSASSRSSRALPSTTSTWTERQATATQAPEQMSMGSTKSMQARAHEVCNKMHPTKCPSLDTTQPVCHQTSPRCPQLSSNCVSLFQLPSITHRQTITSRTPGPPTCWVTLWLAARSWLPMVTFTGLDR